MDSETTIVQSILQFDNVWCQTLGIFNPYLDPYDVHFSPQLPMYDITAYNKYPKHNYVYDKLWIAKTQKLKCGTLEHIHKRNDVQYPIFIKPRWGHKSASSKNCYKIKHENELKAHMDKEDMIWTDFIDAQETMTDFLMLNGKIMYQMTSVYSEKQNGFIDDYKYISEENRPPEVIVDWVNEHMKDYSGVCNVQYRGDKIIEVSLRLSRGGCYMKSTNNTNIIKNINNIIDNNSWDYTIAQHMSYRPFYSYKCYTNMFIIYLFPQYLIDYIMKLNGCKEFYEYFFEPSGKQGMVFFQFLHEDHNIGMCVKKNIENLFFLSQLFFIIAFTFMIYAYFKNIKYSNVIFYGIIVLFLTRLLNPLATNYSLLKAQKQQLF